MRCGAVKCAILQFLPEVIFDFNCDAMFRARPARIVVGFVGRGQRIMDGGRWLANVIEAVKVSGIAVAEISAAVPVFRRKVPEFLFPLNWN